jgi:hypothetical protein
MVSRFGISSNEQMATESKHLTSVMFEAFELKCITVRHRLSGCI